ncbi:MAG: hypothetical protein M3Q69_14525 [Acidobacteriota bacterium]|nr:hypothetical protein [Acidobacteriota bacterium]
MKTVVIILGLTLSLPAQAYHFAGPEERTRQEIKQSDQEITDCICR